MGEREGAGLAPPRSSAEKHEAWQTGATRFQRVGSRRRRKASWPRPSSGEGGRIAKPGSQGASLAAWEARLGAMPGSLGASQGASTAPGGIVAIQGAARVLGCARSGDEGRGRWLRQREGVVIYKGSWLRQRECVVIYEGSWPRERECIVIYKGSWLRQRECVVIYTGSLPRERECVVIYTGSWPQPSSGESQEATAL